MGDQGGRPSKYDPAFCEEAWEVLSEGFSVAALAGKIGVARSTVYEWIDAHQEFSDAVKAGQAAGVAWWEDRLRGIAKGEDGNATATIFGLKNRAPDEWRDRTETHHSGGVTIESVAMTFVRPEASASDA